MSKDFGGLYDLPTKKATVTKVKAKQHFNFQSRGSVILNIELIHLKLQPFGYGMVHMAAHSM